jgi:sugar phosphate isomerase/epimerase
MATGYMWGFWQGPGYDLVAEGKDRFVQKTQRIRDHARKLGIVLGHEIHPGTAAMCADDFMMLLDICDDDVSLGVNIDPSHCWEGESWQDRFSIVGERCVACHVKNHVIRKGFPLRCMESDWRFRGMQFTDLKTGDINLPRFVEAVTADTDYAQNYRQAMHLQSGDTVPLVVEAESAHRELDKTSADGVAYVRDELCIDVAAGSFEDGMGADKQ